MIQSKSARQSIVNSGEKSAIQKTSGYITGCVEKIGGVMR